MINLNDNEKAYIKRNKQFLMNDDLDGFYSDIDTLTVIESSEITQFLEENEIDVLNTVTYIPWGAYNDRGDLEVLVIPSQVTMIQNFAFTRCENLTEVHLPDNDIRVEPLALGRNPNLKAIYVGDKAEINKKFYNNVNKDVVFYTNNPAVIEMCDALGLAHQN